MALELQFNRRIHPSKAVFQSYDIRLGPIARYLDVEYCYLSKVLNGLRTPSPELDRRIRDLANQLEFEMEGGLMASGEFSQQLKAK